MTVNELIAELQKIAEINGELPVKVVDNLAIESGDSVYYYSIDSVEISNDEIGHPIIELEY